MPLQPRDPETDGGGVHTQREKRRGGKGAKGKVTTLRRRTYVRHTAAPPPPPHGVSAARIAVASVLTARIVAALRHCCGGAPRPGAARRGLAAHPRRGPLLPLCVRKKKVVKKMAVVTLRPSFPDAPPSSSRRRKEAGAVFSQRGEAPFFLSLLYYTDHTLHILCFPPPGKGSPLLPSIHILRIGRRERSFHITTKQCVRRCSIVCCIEILFPAHENETGRGLGSTPACKILTSEEEIHRTFLEGGKM